jgi:hypothetical protein
MAPAVPLREAARARPAPGSFQLEIAHLKEQLASRTKALFGDYSERRVDTEQKSGERKDPRPSHGPRQNLPIVEVTHGNPFS